MALLILGLLVFFGAAAIPKTTEALAKLRGPLRILGLLLIALGAMTACIVQIDAGYIGVQKLFGRVKQNVLREGLHLVNPLVDVIEIDSRTQNYTMSGQHDEGNQSGDDAIRVLTADGLEVIIDLTVLFRVLPNQGIVLLGC